MLNKGNLIKVSGIAVLIAALFTQPAQAYAWWGGRDSRWNHEDRVRHVYHPYPTYGRVVVGLPGGLITLAIGGSRYYYCEGVFYRRTAREYIVIAPPSGAVVQELPDSYQPVVINGNTYFTADGIYYQYTQQGYVVVPPPVVTRTIIVQQPQPVVVAQPAPVPVPAPVQVPVSVPAAPSPNDTFTVNIPNSQGGYTAVTIKRSGNGFAGPQGEFYAEFPKVEQLKAMYVK